AGKQRTRVCTGIRGGAGADRGSGAGCGGGDGAAGRRRFAGARSLRLVRGVRVRVRPLVRHELRLPAAPYPESGALHRAGGSHRLRGCGCGPVGGPARLGLRGDCAWRRGGAVRRAGPCVLEYGVLRDARRGDRPAAPSSPDRADPGDRHAWAGPAFLTPVLRAKNCWHASLRRFSGQGRMPPATSARFVGFPDTAELPIYLTPLLGREADVARVCSLFREARLVSLVGAGGSGKTRLAAAVGTAMRRRFAGGVAWIDLSALANSQAVARHAAPVLGAC